MKNMTDIYAGIEENLKDLAPKMAEKQAVVDELEKKIEILMAKQEEAEAELKAICSQYEALKKMKEAAESADFHLKEKEIEETTGAAIVQKPVKQIPWTRKNGTLIQIDRNHNKIGTFSSQKAAARILGWDQGSMSKFIRMDPDTQIRKKGFAFQWVP